VVEVPPLHHRLDDLEAYLRYRPHTGAESTWAALSPAALDVVRHHRWDGPWGGNFRELENFAARLPDAKGAGSIDASTCRRAIDAGAIAPIARAAREPRIDLSFARWSDIASSAAGLAAATYVEDHGSGPAEWNAVKDYIENHLKPVLFAKLAGVEDTMTLEAARSETARLGVDRATRAKQLERYFERFITTDSQPRR
jgi:DNA-binding NtrC family response regulator